MSNIRELQTDPEDGVLRVKAIGGMDTFGCELTGGIIADAHVPDGYEVDDEGLKLIAVAKDGTITKTLVSS